ncbi:hypothetical protein AB0I39_16920 [Kitasatospora purpeofusca]
MIETQAAEGVEIGRDNASVGTMGDGAQSGCLGTRMRAAQQSIVHR